MEPTIEPSLQAVIPASPITLGSVDIIIPPEASYDFLNTLEKAINDFAKPRGCGFVGGSTKHMPSGFEATEGLKQRKCRACGLISHD